MYLLYNYYNMFLFYFYNKIPVQFLQIEYKMNRRFDNFDVFFYHAKNTLLATVSQVLQV